MIRFSSMLDPWLFRRPFEGLGARRYADGQRSGFGDLDQRLLRAWQPELEAAATVLDVGAGPGVFTRALAAAFPHLRVMAVEPSAAFTRDSGATAGDGDRASAATAADGAAAPRTKARADAAAPDGADADTTEITPPGAAPGAGVVTVRARAEALPVAAGSIDVSVCLSSIRHVADRYAALHELRRVASPAGVAYIVELDPSSTRERWRRHTEGMRSRLSRLVFVPVIGRTAPPAGDIARLACDAGWSRAEIHPDPVQPVYIIRLSK